MIAPETPSCEVHRLAALRSLGLLDTDPEERFDRITRLATQLFDVPHALVSLVDADRQWFKSNQGIAAPETPREVSFCGHAIHGRPILHVHDATLDPRFADNPLVTGEPHIRFYAGCPISAPDGSLVGTLCILDRQPRELTATEAQSLQDLAAIVERELAMHRLAINDELTGLHNRRGVQLLGTQALELAVRRKHPASVLYMDLDGLKPVNDRFGHAAGDELIVEAADTLRATFRHADVIGRVGGDEFAVVLSDVDDPSLPVGRLRREIDRRNAEDDGDRPALRLTVGAARFDPVAPESLDDLLERADASMYEGKRPGR